jgi:tetratricopeptide (TPR) repeat protein
MVAHHYAQALDLARAASTQTPDLLDAARRTLGDAGDRAAALHALAQAEGYYGQAVDLVAVDDPRRPELLFKLGRVRFHFREDGEAELTAAHDGFLAVGRPERAAEALLLLADLAWNQGKADETSARLAEARSLVDGTAASRVLVSVLSEAARYEANELGSEALRRADELGLEDLRGHALNNLGTSHAAGGDTGGFAELEESIAIAKRLNSIPDVIRGLNNLAACRMLHGNRSAARQGQAEASELAHRFGYLGYQRFMETFDIASCYILGEWDEAARRIEAFLAEASDVQALGVRGFRALIRLSRGDSAVRRPMCSRTSRRSGRSRNRSRCSRRSGPRLSCSARPAGRIWRLRSSRKR